MIEIGGTKIPPAQQRRIEIPVARLPTQTMLSLPVVAINGFADGPTLWVSAAIHGDELNGVEIIHRVLQQISPHKLRGTLIAVPIVNVFGFIEQSRYLPDRRDLNRSFPGSKRGSLASRLANLFMEEIVSRSTHGIDLHTASAHRHNLPQIRANLYDPITYQCAKAFGAPAIVHSQIRDGSLRQAATQKGIPVLLYEAGEALRFNSQAIHIGVEGILRVMAALDMYDFQFQGVSLDPIEVKTTLWVRASRSGMLQLQVELGERVYKRQILGVISDAFGGASFKVRSPGDGVVLGYQQNPLVNQGDAIVHLAIVNIEENRVLLPPPS
ncbi:succinylglutamate desuccinylase/aspartoacylase family protein [Lyngbya sp. CCY1209]|uniref:succinylglutamate desuccinylase/aspartoacylase family protein n=1 Tax=Lyngbya sp. CCY1209 TaxID=2886103 RepID=UPI002D20D550|nr:succinylglutamate desuccinylase/aspartoacylase family protein [Lyngbya sp. CCY1209]MEB3882819.1 succinylglutamate desuccinylase/aspartoacylase family protein [Lyngbya sp. CCY1209]